MDYGELIALGSLAVGALVLAVIVVGAWALGRQHERRNVLADGGHPDALAHRLERMEHMLETLSTDVERIADAQRVAPRPRIEATSPER